MNNQNENQSNPIYLYQNISSSMNQQKCQTSAYLDSECQIYTRNLETNYSNPQIQNIKAYQSIPNKEYVKSYIYKNNIKQEDLLLLICTFYNETKNYFQFSTYQGQKQLFYILESIFKSGHDNDIHKIIDKNTQQSYNQQQMQIMADIWFLINKYSQDGKDIINYYDAFLFWNLVLKKHFPKFDTFLIFLVEKQQVKLVEITSDLYNQILKFCFSYQTNEHHKHLWNQTPLILEFMNYEQEKRQNNSEHDI